MPLSVCLYILRSRAVKYSGACPVSALPLYCVIPNMAKCVFIGRREILDGMLGANLVCFQVGAPHNCFI